MKELTIEHIIKTEVEIELYKFRPVAYFLITTLKYKRSKFEIMFLIQKHEHKNIQIETH